MQSIRFSTTVPLHRCRFRPGDQTSADPYVLQRQESLYEKDKFAYDYDAPNFHVRQSVIYIDASDASPGGNAPQPRTIVKRGLNATIHSQVTILPEHDKTRQEWYRKVGELIAAVMFNKLPKNRQDRPFVLGRFPTDMVFFRRAKTHSDKPESRLKPRSDAYLRSTTGMIFRTPQEFARHAMWLMDGQPSDATGRSLCLCKFCDRVEDPRRPGKSLPGPQRPITKDLYLLAGYSTAEAEVFSREASVEVDELIFEWSDSE